MKFRFFGSKKCARCQGVKLLLDDMQEAEICKYEYIDAFADETQDFCDTYDVEELPHIQCLDEAGNVVENHIGRDACHYMIEISKTLLF